MMTRRFRLLNFGDWVIVVGLTAAALLFVAAAVAAVVSLRVQTENQRLIQEVHALAKKSDRNHADNMVIKDDLAQFCAAYHITCTVVRP